MQNRIDLTILTTIFPRSKVDYSGAFIGRMVSSISKYKNINIKIIVPSSKESPLYEEWKNNIKIFRFKYWFKQSQQKVAYGDGKGTILNLKSSLLSVIQLPFYFFSFFYSVLKAWSNTSIFHCQWSFTAIFPIIINKIPFIKDRPIIVTFRGTDLRILPGWFNKFIIKNSTILTYVSPIKSINRYKDNFGSDIINYVKRINGKELFCIFDPLDEKNLNINDKTYLDDLKIKGAKIILSLGRLDEIKNPIYSLEIIRSLLKYRTDFIYIIVGYGFLEEKVKNFISINKLDSYVKFEGAKKNVADYYANSDLLLVTSHFDNVWSSTIAEAMMLGCPTVLTDAGYTSDVFKDGFDSIIIDKYNSENAAKKINYLLDNENLRTDISKNAKLTLRKYRRYDDQSSEDYYKLYLKIISEFD